MKTMKRIIFNLVVVSLFAGSASLLSASATDLNKTYTWKYSINKDARVAFDNYDCNIIVHTWDKSETEYHLTVDVKTKSDEDAAVLDNYLQNLKFSNSQTSVSFRDSFWQTRTNIMGKTTMELEGGKKIALTDIKIKGELWIPATCRFELSSKYSEINMEDFSGQLFLDLYNDNFFGANVKGKSEIKDKYSTIEFKNMQDIKADLYNSKLEAVNTGDMKIESKYSKVTAVSSGNLDLNSYNDKYSIPKTGDIIFVAKYSDIKTETSGQISLDCYEGSVIINDARDIKITSKYADFQFAVAGNITVSSSYNDKLAAGKLTSLKISDSKYCSYRVDEMISSLTEAEGYEDKFMIQKTGQEFKELRINGKYADISFSLPKTVDFRFKANITYPKLDMDESQLKARTKISEDSRLEYDAIKGTEKEGMPVIEVNGYEMSLKITEL